MQGLQVHPKISFADSLVKSPEIWEKFLKSGQNAWKSGLKRHPTFLTRKSSKHLDAIAIERSMLVKPTKRKYQKEVLQILDHKRIKEFHRRSGKRNNGKCFVEKTLEKKKHFTESEQIFKHREALLSQEQNSLRRCLENIEMSAFATHEQIESKRYFRKNIQNRRIP